MGHTVPPDLLLGTQVGTQGSTCHLHQRNMGNGCPGLGFYRETRFPPPCGCRVRSPGLGGGTRITTPSSSRGRKLSTRSPGPRRAPAAGPGEGGSQLTPPPQDPRPPHPHSSALERAPGGKLSPGTGQGMCPCLATCPPRRGTGTCGGQGHWAQAWGPSQGKQALESGCRGEELDRRQTRPTRGLSGLHSARGTPQETASSGGALSRHDPPTLVGPQGLATGPRVSQAGGHEGARDVTSADQAHAPTRLRGGNALSHSYERSSLLEGRGKPRITPSHSWMPRLQGRGGWSPEPTHQDTTHLDTLSREKASGSPHPHKSTSRPHLAMGLISWP